MGQISLLKSYGKLSHTREVFSSRTVVNLFTSMTPAQLCFYLESVRGVFIVWEPFCWCIGAILHRCGCEWLTIYFKLAMFSNAS